MRLRWQAMWVAFWALLAPLVLSSLRAETFFEEGHGGVPLAVTVAAPEGGSEILLLNGIGMGAESISPQLSEHYRMSPRLGDHAEAYELLAPMLFEVTDEGPSEKWQQRTKMLAGLVPPCAQVHLRAHPADNAGLVPHMARLPLLVVNGVKDLAHSAADLTAFRQAFNHAKIQTFADAGHSPFAEQPTAFNAVLAGFVSSHWEPVK